MSKFIMIVFALLATTFFDSCKTVEVTTTTPTQAAAKAGLVLQTFTQKYINDVSETDSANWMNNGTVYNSSAIELSLFIYDKKKSLTIDENGDSHKGGQNTEIKATVPQMTPGKKSNLMFGEDGAPRWVLTSFSVTFDLSDKTFTFKFKRVAGGAFLLDPKAKVVYLDKEYENVRAQAKDCILLFYGEQNQNTMKITKIAQGVKSGGSTRRGESTEPFYQKSEEY